jgi:hypothetical protein
MKITTGPITTLATSTLANAFVTLLSHHRAIEVETNCKLNMRASRSQFTLDNVADTAFYAGMNGEWGMWDMPDLFEPTQLNEDTWEHNWKEGRSEGGALDAETEGERQSGMYDW